MLETFLQEIYDGFDTSDAIEPTAWREVLRIMNEGAVEGLTASTAKTHDVHFLERLKHSNEVFSAFKVHKMSKQVAERLIAPDGSLRSFEEWKSSVKGITSHYTDAWLRTEYDTAVIRAHQAADWQEYEANKDFLPNLRWMPTTSPLPDGEHRVFWEGKLCLPVDDPFWSRHRPGDRWNCKCSLEPTDDTVVRLDPKDEGEAAPAQRGLENNPKDGQLFSDKHPYFPSNCAACPFYTETGGVRNAIRRLFTSRQKDCHNCPYIDRAIDTAKLAEGEVYTNYGDYGDRLQISAKADPTDLEDNIRVAKALLDSFPRMKVKVNPHHRDIKGRKNPELKINGVIADNKRVKGEQGISDGFSKAKNQGCKAVVIDLDHTLKRLNIKELSKYIDWRKADFESGAITECYIVYDNKAVVIDKVMSRQEIKETLKKLKS